MPTMRRFTRKGYGRSRLMRTILWTKTRLKADELLRALVYYQRVGCRDEDCAIYDIDIITASKRQCIVRDDQFCTRGSKRSTKMRATRTSMTLRYANGMATLANDATSRRRRTSDGGALNAGLPNHAR